jgi:hypothetical protein
MLVSSRCMKLFIWQNARENVEWTSLDIAIAVHAAADAAADVGGGDCASGNVFQVHSDCVDYK